MLWLIIIVMTSGLLFVLFYKPPINAGGAGWVPPKQRSLPAPQPEQPAAPQPVAQAPQTPDTFDFNDVFGGKKQAPPADEARQ